MTSLYERRMYWRNTMTFNCFGLFIESFVSRYRIECVCVCVCSYTNFNVIRLVWHTKDESDWWMDYNKFLIIGVERELLCDKLF